MLALIAIAVSTALFAVVDVDPMGDVGFLSPRASNILTMLSFNVDLLALGVIIRMFVAIQARFEARTRILLTLFDLLLLSLCVVMWIPVALLVYKPKIAGYFYMPVTLFYIVCSLIGLSVGAERVLRFASEQDNQNSAYGQATRRLLRLTRLSRWAAVLVVIFFSVTNAVLGDSQTDRLIRLGVLHSVMIFLLGIGLVVVGKPAQVSPQDEVDGPSRYRLTSHRATATAAARAPPTARVPGQAVRIVVRKSQPGPGPGPRPDLMRVPVSIMALELASVSEPLSVQPSARSGERAFRVLAAGETDRAEDSTGERPDDAG